MNYVSKVKLPSESVVLFLFCMFFLVSCEANNMQQNYSKASRESTSEVPFELSMSGNIVNAKYLLSAGLSDYSLVLARKNSNGAYSFVEPSKNIEFPPLTKDEELHLSVSDFGLSSIQEGDQISLITNQHDKKSYVWLYKNGGFIVTIQVWN